MSRENERNDANRRKFVTFAAAFATASVAAKGADARAESGASSKPLAVSVIDFGADCRGEVDSTRAIQRAIDNAYPVESAEAAVLFPPGRYLLSDTLRVSKRNNLSLLGMRASLVQRRAGKDILQFTDTTHCCIRDLYLNSWSTKSGGNGITLERAVRTLLDNVEVYDVGGHCVWADQSFWLSARDCVFSSPGAGKYAVVHTNDMNSVAYHHCTFVNGIGAGGGGLLHDGGTALSLVACDISSNAVGVMFRQGASLLASNCYFEHNVIGFQWGDSAASTWPMSGTLDNCYFTNRDPAQEPVHIDVQRGTNLRINNPFMLGNGSYEPLRPGNTVGIRVNDDCLAGQNRRVIIDDEPYTELVRTPVLDPGRRLRRMSTSVY